MLPVIHPRAPENPVVGDFHDYSSVYLPVLLKSDILGASHHATHIPLHRPGSGSIPTGGDRENLELGDPNPQGENAGHETPSRRGAEGLHQVQDYRPSRLPVRPESVDIAQLHAAVAALLFDQRTISVLLNNMRFTKLLRVVVVPVVHVGLKG